MGPLGYPKYILLLDDDEDFRSATAEFLLGGGYRVVAVSDGQEALRLCEEEQARAKRPRPYPFCSSTLRPSERISFTSTLKLSGMPDSNVSSPRTIAS